LPNEFLSPFACTDEEIDSVIRKSLDRVLVFHDDNLNGLSIAPGGRVAYRVNQSFEIGPRDGFLLKMTVTSPIPYKPHELFRLEIGVLRSGREVRHVQLAVDYGLGFAQ